ncbi:quinone oxidoreductase family protein [Streptomyces malaysiensis]|uniref:quinone oxidoreductase family protein n=1 Tax=Streptomyces malaysiensis TaxID=92644 RepID=UPI002B285E45|nr:zinc-binding alcohol dehydrogenase family protein [Streptomyces malaysiensis]
MNIDGTMTAAVQTERGGAETLSTAQIPVPSPGPGEVLVRVHRAAVNFADERTCRSGMNHLSGRVEGLPFTPGGEIVGARVDTGERVVAISGKGGFAQYALVDESATYPIPPDLDEESALSVFVPGLTAGLLLDVTRPQKDDCTVVSGATGAIGTLLLQLLGSSGQSHVVAVASPSADVERLRSFGASTVVPSDSEDLTSVLRAAAEDRPIGLILDSIGGPVLEAAVAALGRRGRLVSYGSSSNAAATVAPRSLIFGSREIAGFWVLDHLDNRSRVVDVLADLFRAVLDSRLRVDPPTVFALDDVAGAMAATAQRGRTCRVLIDPWK